jgi:hypothetical protein
MRKVSRSYFLDPVANESVISELGPRRRVSGDCSRRGCEQEVAHADEELNALEIGITRRRGRGHLVGQKRTDQSAAKIGEREPLGVGGRIVGATDSHGEVDERVVRVSAIDRHGGDAGARDHRERKKALADDLAESLETAYPLADTLEPTIGANGVEGEDLTDRHDAITSVSCLLRRA